MISPTYPLVLLALASPTAPAPDIPPPREKPKLNNLAAVARAADAPVAVADCVSSVIACYKLDTGVVHISPQLYRILTRRSCNNPTSRSRAAFVLAHEAGHAHGIYSESGANTYAYDRIWQVSRTLKLDVRHAPAIGSLAASWNEWGGGC